MSAVEVVFGRAVERWTSLSISARLALGGLAIGLAAVLWAVFVWAGRPEMVALGVAEPVSAEVRARVGQELASRDAQLEERGGALYVPAEHQLAVLAALAGDHHIRTDQIDFEKLLEKDSPFTDRRTRSRRYLVAKMNVVARMIGELEGIERATVIIDQPERTGFGPSFVAPTASVNVVPRGERVPEAEADAIAQMVAGAHAPLRVEHVTVVDARSGRAIRTHGDEDMYATKHLELKREAEQHLQKKLEAFLSYIPGVRVAINAQVDATEVVSHRLDVADPVSAIAEETVREHAAIPLEGTGDLPLAGWDAPSASGTDLETMTRSEVEFGREEITTRDGRGYALKVNAAVSVPRSWFLTLYHGDTGWSEGPVDATKFDPLVAGEVERLRSSIAPLIDTDAMLGATAGLVAVDMYADAASLRTVASPATAGAAAGTAAGATPGRPSFLQRLLERPVQAVAVAVLAIGIMVILVLILRRAPNDDGGARVAVQGADLDDADVGFELLLGEINTLARQAPEEAARMLRRWIRRDG